MEKSNEIFSEVPKKLVLPDFKSKLKRIDLLKNVVEDLTKLDPKAQSFPEIMRHIKIYEHFTKTQRKIRIPVFGVYSSGKSTILNTIIGCDILPSSTLICTQTGVIIRHHDSEIPILCNTEFKKEENYWIFEDGTEILRGEKEINKYLKNKNDEIEENTKIENQALFYVLKIKIDFFEYMDPFIREKIELIDFPGLNTKNNYFRDNILNPLMDFSDFFFFINDCNKVEINDNIQIANKLLKEIELRKSKNFFDISMCLFIFNKIDNDTSKKINWEEYIEKFCIYFGTEKKLKLKYAPISAKLYRDSVFSLKYINVYIQNKFETFEKSKTVIIKKNPNFLKFVIKDLKDTYLNKINLKDYQENDYNNFEMSSEVKSKIIQLQEMQSEDKLKAFFSTDNEVDIIEFIRLYQIAKLNIHSFMQNSKNFKDSKYEDFRILLIDYLTHNYIKLDNEFKNKEQILFNDMESLFYEINIKINTQKKISSESINIITSNIEEINQLCKLKKEEIKKEIISFKELINSLISDFTKSPDQIKKLYKNSNIKYEDLITNLANAINENSKQFENLIEKITTEFELKISSLLKEVVDKIDKYYKEIATNMDTEVFKNVCSKAHGITHLSLCGAHAIAHTFGIAYSVGAGFSWGPVGWAILGTTAAVHGIVLIVNFFVDLFKKESTIIENFKKFSLDFKSNLDTRYYHFEKYVDEYSGKINKDIDFKLKTITDDFENVKSDLKTLENIKREYAEIKADFYLEYN